MRECFSFDFQKGDSHFALITLERFSTAFMANVRLKFAFCQIKKTFLILTHTSSAFSKEKKVEEETFLAFPTNSSMPLPVCRISLLIT